MDAKKRAITTAFFFSAGWIGWQVIRGEAGNFDKLIVGVLLGIIIGLIVYMSVRNKQ